MEAGNKEGSKERKKERKNRVNKEEREDEGKIGIKTDKKNTRKEKWSD